MAIVCLEGIDASGKQTQVRKVAEWARRINRFDRVETFDFPHYQTIAGGLIGRMLREEVILIGPVRHEDRLRGDHALALQCAFLADRLEHSQMLRHFEDEPDELLVLDRYYMSGIVYGQVDGLNRDWLYAIHEILPTPNRIFVLDVPVEESVRRRPDRRDYYEKALPKLRRARELYLAEAATDPGGTEVIDGTLEAETITARIITYILEKLR